MIRTVVYLLVAVLLITVLRSVIGMIGRVFSEFLLPRDSTQARNRAAAGELKKDPVCGTYVDATSSVKKTANGEVIHFCSPACRDKYRG